MIICSNLAIVFQPQCENFEVHRRESPQITCLGRDGSYLLEAFLARHRDFHIQLPEEKVYFWCVPFNFCDLGG